MKIDDVEKNFDTFMFDLDRTLVDSVQSICNSINYVLKEVYGETRKDEEIAPLIGISLREVLKILVKGIDEKTLDRCQEIYIDHYMKESIDLVKLLPGTLELLQFLKDNGVKVGIITQRKKKLAEIVLDNTDIKKYCDIVVGADEVKNKKPHPEPLEKAMTELKSRADCTVYVGDHVFDVEAGRAAGVFTCGVLTGSSDKKTLKKVRADLIVNDLVELKNILKK
jgi:2-phosphoglycolate phosphatase